MNATTKTTGHSAGQAIIRYVASSRFVLATCTWATATALLMAPAPVSAGKINLQTGQPQLTARQIIRLDKLRADTHAVAIRKALGAVDQPLHRRVIPVRPSWLAPKGQR